jgi:hypothetical protein
MSALHKPKKRETIERIPLPEEPFESDRPANLVTYLRALTKRLIEAKQEFIAMQYRYEDSDFLADFIKSFNVENSKYVKTWSPFMQNMRECSDCANMSWPECCFQVLKKFRVSVTPRELADDFRGTCQKDGKDDGDFIWDMRRKARGLAGILSRSEALAITVANLQDTRVRKPAEEKLRSAEITSFQQLYDLAVDINDRYVGSSRAPKDPAPGGDRGRPQVRPLTGMRPTVHQVQSQNVESERSEPAQETYDTYHQTYDQSGEGHDECHEPEQEDAQYSEDTSQSRPSQGYNSKPSYARTPQYTHRTARIIRPDKRNIANLEMRLELPYTV